LACRRIQRFFQQCRRLLLVVPARAAGQKWMVGGLVGRTAPRTHHVERALPELCLSKCELYGRRTHVLVTDAEQNPAMCTVQASPVSAHHDGRALCSASYGETY
jgi:hypothetical protein